MRTVSRIAGRSKSAFCSTNSVTSLEQKWLDHPGEKSVRVSPRKQSNTTWRIVAVGASVRLHPESKNLRPLHSPQHFSKKPTSMRHATHAGAVLRSGSCRRAHRRGAPTSSPPPPTHVPPPADGPQQTHSARPRGCTVMKRGASGGAVVDHGQDFQRTHNLVTTSKAL